MAPGRFLASSTNASHGLPGRVGAHHQHGRVGRVARHRPQFGQGEHGCAPEHGIRFGNHRQRRQRQQHRVAVGLGLGRQAHADAAAGAGLVLDDHRLAQLARQRLGHGSRHEVGQAARREGHDHGDGARRPVALRSGQQGRGGDQGAQQGFQGGAALHACVSLGGFAGAGPGRCWGSACYHLTPFPRRAHPRKSGGGSSA